MELIVVLVLLLILAPLVLQVAAYWMVYAKAGAPGWAALVSLDLARSFHKADGFGVGLWLLPVVFMPVLAFGHAEYGRPAAA